MKNKSIAALCMLVLVAASAIAASAQSTHSVWTNNNGYVIADATTGCWYQNLAGFEMSTSWTEPAPPTYPAVAHFRGISRAYAFSSTCNTSHDYEFRLVRASTTTNDDIFGRWNVYRDGVLMCSGCSGTAYGMSQAAGVGNYYKVYIDDPVYGPSTWLYCGFIDSRKDF